MRYRTIVFAAAVMASIPFAAAAQEAAPARSQDAYALSREAYAAIQQKDYSAALQSAQKALAIDPRNQSALYYAGFSQSAMGAFPQAEEAYRALIAVNPRHPSAYTGLGIVYGRQGRVDDAVAMFRKQLEIVPRGRYASSNLARALASQGKWAEALAPAAAAAEAAPQETGYWLFLGVVQIKSGHAADGRQSFDRLLALPHEPMMENNVAYELANAGLDLDRSWKLIAGVLGQSENLFCDSKTVAEGDNCTAQLRQAAYILDTAGWVLVRQGKIAQAEPYIRSAYAINPHGENKLHMIVVLARTGHVEDAARLYADVRTNPNFERVDTGETLRELTRAAGGDAEWSALLDRVAPSASAASPDAKVVALVDGRGKVAGIASPDTALPGVAEAAKSMTLGELSWPGHSLSSVRTIEFHDVGGQWMAVQSYVGLTPPPPPCKVVRQLPILVTRNAGAPEPSQGCPADF